MICPHFGRCGGCTRQDVPYDRQLEQKETRVRDALAGLAVEAFHPIVGSPDLFYYRNKMEFSFGDRRDLVLLDRPSPPAGLTRRQKRAWLDERRVEEDALKRTAAADHRVHLGLHPRGRFNIVTPTPECMLMSEVAQSILHVVGTWATECGIESYTRHDNAGTLRHLVVREGKNTGERLVNLFTTSRLPNADELAARLRAPELGITTFIWTINDDVSDVARGADSRVLWGEGLIREKVGDVTLRVPPHAFMQTNTRAAEAMIRVVKAWMGGDASRGVPGRRLFDLYCGSGAIGLNLAGSFDALIGIELDEAAVEEARRNAETNGVRSARFVAGRVERLLDEMASPDPAADRLIVDPPRAGLHTHVTEALAASNLPLIVYVSCNPDTLARDLRALEARYRIRDVQPMDFFPHTDHVETAVRLTRIPDESPTELMEHAAAPLDAEEGKGDEEKPPERGPLTPAG